MRITALHERLLADVLAIGAPYGLALAGGYAVQVHELVERPGEGLDVATESPAPMAEIAAGIGSGLRRRGWQVGPVEADVLSARLLVAEPTTGEECELDVSKEVLWRPPVDTDYGLALSVEDAVGTAVRALVDRGLARDLVDVRAGAARWSHVELEELGRRHARADFDLTELQARLAGAEYVDDSEFAAQGLDESATVALRAWAQAWNDDIAERLQEQPPTELD